METWRPLMASRWEIPLSWYRAYTSSGMSPLSPRSIALKMPAFSPAQASRTPALCSRILPSIRRRGLPPGSRSQLSADAFQYMPRES